jgi:hypothetical protein
MRDESNHVTVHNMVCRTRAFSLQVEFRTFHGSFTLAVIQAIVVSSGHCRTGTSHTSTISSIIFLVITLRTDPARTKLSPFPPGDQSHHAPTFHTYNTMATSYYPRVHIQNPHDNRSTEPHAHPHLSTRYTHLALPLILPLPHTRRGRSMRRWSRPN